MLPTCWSHNLDHRGLVASMCDDLGIGDVIDQAPQYNPAMRIVTTGTAVKAIVLNGLCRVAGTLMRPPDDCNKSRQAHIE